MIKKEEIKDALQRSGYLLECRIAKWLFSKGYEFATNISFQDPVTEKTREIDIIGVPIGCVDGKLNIAHHNSLIIEAINNTVPIVFFQNEGFSLAGTACTLPKYVTTPKNEVDEGHFLNHINLYECYHTSNGRFSTQYCSFQEKKSSKVNKKNNKNEWMAYHPDELYQTFLKLYYYTKSTIKSWSESLPDHDWIRLFIYQPILILQGEIYRVEVDGTDFKLKNVDYIQFFFEQYYKGIRDSIVVDVMTEKYIPQYISMISEEEKVIFQRMLNFYSKKKKNNNLI